MNWLIVQCAYMQTEHSVCAAVLSPKSLICLETVVTY